jgi:hypothetical protein
MAVGVASALSPGSSGGSTGSACMPPPSGLPSQTRPMVHTPYLDGRMIVDMTVIGLPGFRWTEGE